MNNIPIYRAKKIDSDEYVEGYYYETSIFNRHAIRDNDGDSEIDPSTLEISDGIKYRKLSECNFRTDHELDMHLRNGYCDGWNSALNKKPISPHKKFPNIGT